MGDGVEWISKAAVAIAAERLRAAMLDTTPKLTGEFADHEVRRVVRIAAEYSGRVYENPTERREAIATMLNYHASTLVSADVFADGDDYEQILQDVIKKEREALDSILEGYEP